MNIQQFPDHDQELSEDILKLPDFEIDLSTRKVQLRDRNAMLSTKEFKLLVYLARTPNKVVKMNDLFHHIWGLESFGDTRTLMVHISNLRKKIEPDPANPTYIITVRGVGYKFKIAT